MHPQSYPLKAIIGGRNFWIIGWVEVTNGGYVPVVVPMGTPSTMAHRLDVGEQFTVVQNATP